MVRNRLFAQHPLKLILADGAHAEADGLGELAAGILTHNEVIRLFGDGAGGLCAEDQQLVLDLIAGIVDELAGGNDGLTVERVVAGIEKRSSPRLALVRSPLPGCRRPLISAGPVISMSLSRRWAFRRSVDTPVGS